MSRDRHHARPMAEYRRARARAAFLEVMAMLAALALIVAAVPRT